jgi:hypothetical protein
MFTQVAVKKKSFCGSINSDKPCLYIDFGKFSEANVPVIKALIGSRYLTLNNTIHQWRIPKGKRLVRNRIHGSIPQWLPDNNCSGKISRRTAKKSGLWTRMGASLHYQWPVAPLDPTTSAYCLGALKFRELAI